MTWRNIFKESDIGVDDDAEDFDVLWRGEFISVVSPRRHPYEAVIDKDLVLIVPIRNGDEVGIRLELCPPYLIRDDTGQDRYYTVMSGGIEEGESPQDAAFRELEEEAGIVVKKATVVSIFKNKPIAKVLGTRATMLAILIDQYEEHDPSGDGSEYEDEAETIWIKKENFTDIVDKGNYDMLVLSAMMTAKQLLNQNVRSAIKKAAHECTFDTYDCGHHVTCRCAPFVRGGKSKRKVHHVGLCPSCIDNKGDI